MLRPAALVLLVILGAIPVAVLPEAPVTWVAVVAMIVGGAGVMVLAVRIVTAGASLGVIAYALALALARPPLDPAAAMAFGATLVLLLALVHFAARVRGAVVAPAVGRAQVRQWLVTVALGLGAAMVVTLGAAALRPSVGGVTLPVIVVGTALGTLLAAAAIVALLAATGGRRRV
jgi:hypothetical protein